MEQSKKHGGKRHNSGRKPVEDKKLQVTLYIKSSIIDAFGTMEEFKSQVHHLIQEEKDYRDGLGKMADNVNKLKGRFV